MDGPCTMEQFRDGRSIPPGYLVPGGKDDRQKEEWKIEDFCGKKDGNDG